MDPFFFLLLKPHVEQWTQKFHMFWWVSLKEMSAKAILIHKDVYTVDCFWQKDLTNFELLKYEVHSPLNIK